MIIYGNLPVSKYGCVLRYILYDLAFRIIIAYSPVCTLRGIFFQDFGVYSRSMVRPESVFTAMTDSYCNLNQTVLCSRAQGCKCFAAIKRKAGRGKRFRMNPFN